MYMCFLCGIIIPNSILSIRKDEQDPHFLSLYALHSHRLRAETAASRADGNNGDGAGGQH